MLAKVPYASIYLPPFKFSSFRLRKCPNTAKPFLAITRSLAQKSACKGLGRNGLNPGHHAQGRLHSDF
ncbi:hypothetical protein BVJ53_00135 [Lacticaseibacillus chiayiensis]|uniref:Uncharacterized protein n=1 Tax=Lacticaseibacillus chiayiensis TaxID=2100821 RepID=A0A4Q1UFY0_9LACO|nr:hypothetical protein BVJ53_00135 [Lacticaseibacillus chiayiensis]RXT56764.1 hypothetical protein CHT97_11085 [Lacticaseibacillus chiayiensis]